MFKIKKKLDEWRNQKRYEDLFLNTEIEHIVKSFASKLIGTSEF